MAFGGHDGLTAGEGYFLQPTYITVPVPVAAIGTSEGVEMERAGFLLKVRKDKLEEYKKKHENVWPELLDALRRHGWRNYSLFLGEDGQLFGYVEAEESLEKSLEGMAGEDVNLQWQDEFAHLFESITGRPDEATVKLEHYFHLD